MTLKAVLFDLGDVIMREETEEKIDGITHRAELLPGMADLLPTLHSRGLPIGQVADTRDGTYRNVLGKQGILELFNVFAISDHLGIEKPDRRMFAHALEGLCIPEVDWDRVVMVGNNLTRDIRGAKALGMMTIWMVWNQRYPIACVDDARRPTIRSVPQIILSARWRPWQPGTIRRRGRIHRRFHGIEMGSENLCAKSFLYYCSLGESSWDEVSP